MQSVTDQFSPASGLLASPALTTPKSTPRRAIPDAARAKMVVSELLQANRRRQQVFARILSKLNAERPYDQAALVDEGLGWKHNFSTKPLAAIIDRVSPRFVDVINLAKYLTNSSLPPRYADSTRKTEIFRDKFTKLVRSRPEWRGLLDVLALDDALFGCTVAGWLDEGSWFPDHFRFDHLYLPDGTKQHAKAAQVVCVREDYLVHELFEKIQDPESAKAAGWDLEATRDVINAASPQNVRAAMTNAGSIEVWHQNAERELTVGASYTTGASSIVVYSLLVREPTGKVSHYRIAEPDQALIFSRDDRFAKMEDVFTFFSFQIGNMTMLGSKGIGRDLYDLAAAQDRSRNEVFDRLWMSGKQFVQGDPRQVHKFSMSVVGSMCIIPNGWDVLDRKIDGDVEPFLKLDAFVQGMMDNLVGAVSPRFLQGERVTKAQVDLFASREEESRDSRVGRFLSQLVALLEGMQRRACDPQCEEADAQAFQKDLLQDMTAEEIAEIIKVPVAGVVEDLTPVQRQQMVALATEKRGHPLYNQRELELADVTARLGSDAAQRLILPEADPTMQAEQQRGQQLELVLLTAGQPVAVSPRDNHDIHFEVLLPAIQQLAQTAVTPGQGGTEVLEVCFGHLNEHVTMATQAGSKSPALAEATKLMQSAGKLLADLKQHDAEAAQLAQQQQLLDQEHAGSPDANVPLTDPSGTAPVTTL